MKKHLYQKTFILFLFATQLIFILNAQVPNPVSFHTGVNASLNGVIPLLSNDLSWTASTVSINGPYVPAKRGVNQLAWLTSPYPTADWIAYPHGCSTNPVDHTCDGPVNEFYRLMFTLPATACNNSVNVTGGYCLTMNYFADNSVHEIFVNGISTYTNPASSYIANNFIAGTGHTVTICNNWQPGTNTLIVNVRSGPPTVGFLAFITATATTPGGFSVTTTQSNVSCYALTNGAATVNLTGYSGPATYTWLPAGGNSASAANLSPGIYTVNIQLPLCNLSNTLSITQPSTFAVNVSTTQTICKGAKITFTATGAENYVWKPGNVNGAVATFTPAATTVYTVTGTNAAGCSVSTSFTQQVKNCTGLGETTLQNLQVLTNVTGNLLIITNEEEEYRVEIFDLLGHLKYAGVIIQRSEINITDLASGIYVLRVSNTTSFIRKRIIVSR